MGPKPSARRASASLFCCSSPRSRPTLADLGVPVLEQPLPANRITSYRRLKQQGALPIIMDEGIVSPVSRGDETPDPAILPQLDKIRDAVGDRQG